MLMEIKILALGETCFEFQMFFLFNNYRSVTCFDKIVIKKVMKGVIMK